MTASSETGGELRRAVRLVALLNLGYFGVEFAVALAIGSVSLFADSIDFLEDASVNLLILAALGWGARRRALVGMVLAGQGSRIRNHKLNRTRYFKTEHPGWRSKVSESALQRAPPFHLTVYLTAS